MSRRTHCEGYTLLEVVAYGAVLMLIMNLSASVLIGTKRLHTLGTLAMERNEALDDIARDFRDAVHASIDASGNSSVLPGSPETLVLSAPLHGDLRRYRRWQRDESGRLYFDTYEAGPNRKITLVSRKIYPSSLKVLTLSITRDPAVPLVQLDLVVDNESTLRTVPKNNRFVAALGAP